MADSEQTPAGRRVHFAHQNASPPKRVGEAFIHGWIVASIGFWQGSAIVTVKAPPERAIQYAKELI